MLKLIVNNIVADVKWIRLAQEQDEVAGAAGKTVSFSIQTPTIELAR
jgi:hypothetical protein